MEHVPALYLIFTLLNAFRRDIPRAEIWREFRRQGIRLQPRLSFWLALCRAAGLLREDHTGQPIVTRFARQWLGMPSDMQALHLLDAWQNAPRNVRERQFRKKLLWKLTWNKPLTDKDLRAAPGLAALGLCRGSELTLWGRILLKDEAHVPTPAAVTPWEIQSEHLFASIPGQTQLLWDLEKHLRPCAPGIYPLTIPALRRAAQMGEADKLIRLLEQGVCQAIPDELRARIVEQPSLRVMQGVVLEFSHPTELKALRRTAGLRLHLAGMLSPRHVYLPPNDASRLLPMLKRRGLYLAPVQEELELHRRLKPDRLLPAKVLQPLGAPVPIRDLLQKHIELQQALDILYCAPGYAPERRRITPLLLEQRGEYVYLSAYCQDRRANRTFRLDRMEIPGTISAG